jgi:hypothetical protein
MWRRLISVLLVLVVVGAALVAYVGLTDGHFGGRRFYNHSRDADGPAPLDLLRSDDLVAAAA